MDKICGQLVIHDHDRKSPPQKNPAFFSTFFFQPFQGGNDFFPLQPGFFGDISFNHRNTCGLAFVVGHARLYADELLRRLQGCQSFDEGRATCAEMKLGRPWGRGLINSLDWGMVSSHFFGESLEWVK